MRPGRAVFCTYRLNTIAGPTIDLSLLRTCYGEFRVWLLSKILLTPPFQRHQPFQLLLLPK